MDGRGDMGFPHLGPLKDDPSDAPGGIPEKEVPTLNLLAQIKVIRMVFAQANRLEAEKDAWMKELSRTDRPMADSLSLDCDISKVDAEVIVQKFEERVQRWPNLRRKSLGGGIPRGVKAVDYCEYRKWKYVEDVRKVRSFLADNLIPTATNDLMDTMTCMTKYNRNYDGRVVLTLKAMLTSANTTNFQLFLPESFHYVDRASKIGEFSLGEVVLTRSVLEGKKLTHLSLEKFCFDLLLRVVAEVAPNLQYLNVSNSRISDGGLLHLCGVQKDSTPKDDVQNWKKTGRTGCNNLIHFVAKPLERLTWSLGQGLYRVKYEKVAVPPDAAFVAMLMFMPKLKSFDTEIGVSVIQSWLPMAKRLEKEVNLESMEMISEYGMSARKLQLVNEVCPNLTHLKMSSFDIGEGDWAECLRDCKKLIKLEVDVKDDDMLEFYDEPPTIFPIFDNCKLTKSFPCIGLQLTTVIMKELQALNHSNLQDIKMFCPNLEVLCLAASGEVIFYVEKDISLEMISNKFSLAKLREFCLVGSFTTDIAQYFLKGADQLKCLTLSIDWAWGEVEPPPNHNDFLGLEYLSKVLYVNRLCNLEHIHLTALLKSGRNHLTVAFAEWILKQFPRIKHVGNFRYWNMTSEERNNIIEQTRSVNRDVTFDENFFNEDGEEFDFQYVKSRSCQSFNHRMYQYMADLDSSDSGSSHSDDSDLMV